ncbi:MAG: hypothetical protein QOE97_2955 [Pseudonocardiales bacterium]|nr:hypothetical protein [Pseudonocardiales bacterium]
MRRPFRIVAAAACTALLVTGLSACRSNVGLAAKINGHRITETDVTKYLTPNAEAVPQQDQNTGVTTTIPARTWVLRTLLETQLYTDVLARTPGGQPSQGAITAAQTALLNGTTVEQVAADYAKHGYQRSFASLYLRGQAIQQVLGTEIQNGTVDAQKLLAQLDLNVTVNPRYGAWDPKTLDLSGDPKAGLPNFLTLLPGSTYSPASPSATGSTGSTGPTGSATPAPAAPSDTPSPAGTG